VAKECVKSYDLAVSLIHRIEAMPQLYGLIFDVDGVIADTEPLNARVTIRVLKDMFGLEGVADGDFEAGIGRGAEAYVKAGATAHGHQPMASLSAKPQSLGNSSGPWLA